jgi:Uncharacterized protein conserved in cyanobacteria
MTTSVNRVVLPPAFGDHTQLPDSDGTFVNNFQEHPQSLILTDSIGQILQERHPDGQYAIGQDCGIYWRETEPAEQGAEAPDWFYVPNVPPNIHGQIRRSYVLWPEHIAPLIALEFASGNGDEERDSLRDSFASRTPLSRTDEGVVTKPGKFWVYERVMRIPYYGIYQVNNGRLEVYRLIDGYYQLLELNQRGHFPIAPLGVELGLWQGSYQNQPCFGCAGGTRKVICCRSAMKELNYRDCEGSNSGKEPNKKGCEPRVQNRHDKLNLGQEGMQFPGCWEWG